MAASLDHVSTRLEATIREEAGSTRRASDIPRTENENDFK